jgi:hypothetical protein
MPQSFREQPYVGVGVRHLQESSQPVAVVFTSHLDGPDFYRALAMAEPVLQDSPVLGVEAEHDGPILPDRVGAPQLATRGVLGAFQEAQFDWLARNGKLAQPSEGTFTGQLGERIEQLDDLVFETFTNTPGYDQTARSQLVLALYGALGAYRSWGIAGQFGYWQQHPVVKDLLRGSSAPVPLMLGSAHTYEAEIFGNVCNVPTHAIHTGNAANTSPHDREHAALYTKHTTNGYLDRADLAFVVQ